MLPPFITFGLILLGVLVSFWASRLVARLTLLPNQVEARSNHVVPVSRAGGLAFCAGLVVAFDAAALVIGVSAQVLLLFALGLGAAGLGMLDDARGLPPVPKLAVLAAISFAAALAAGPLPALPLPGLGYVPLPPWLGLVLGTVWILSFTNVFNFLDGLNGMAATTGLILLSAAGGLAVMVEMLSLYLLTLSAAGALFGFALRNILKGAPFLGDAGSLSLGVLISGSILALGQGTGGDGLVAPAALWLAVMGAVPYVADAAYTLIRRARRGERLTQAHSEHVYQRLKRQGRSHEAVAALYGALACLGAAAPLVLGLFPPSAAVIAWGVMTAAAWFVATQILLRRGPQASRTADDLASDASVSRVSEAGRTDRADTALSA